MDTYCVGSCIGNDRPTKVHVPGGGGIVAAGPASDPIYNNSGSLPGIIPRLVKDGWNVIVVEYELHAIGELAADIGPSDTSIQVSNAGSDNYWWPTSTNPNYVIVMCDNLPSTACEQMLAVDGGAVNPASGRGTLTVTVRRQYNSTPSQGHTHEYPTYVADTNGIGAWETSRYRLNDGSMNGTPPAIAYADMTCLSAFLQHAGIGNGVFSFTGGSQGAEYVKMLDMIGSPLLLANANCEWNNALVKPTFLMTGSLPADYAGTALRHYKDGGIGLETTATAAQLGPGYPGQLDSSATPWASGMVGGSDPSCDADGVIPINPTQAFLDAKGGGPRGCLPGRIGCIYPQNSNLTPNLVISGAKDQAIFSPIQPCFVAGSPPGTTEIILPNSGHSLDCTYDCGDGTNYCASSTCGRGFFADVYDEEYGIGGDFGISATAFSPGTIFGGSASASTVTITPLAGFNSPVTLSCPDLPNGITCTFNPTTITPANGGNATSVLTVNAAVDTSPMTYAIGITGTSGTDSHSTSQSLVVQSPQLQLSPSGPSSATVSAGQSANFTLTVSSLPGLGGTVSLSCTISPTPTSAPACTVPSIVQLSANTPAQVSVIVATTAPMTSATISWPNYASPGAPFAWAAVLPICWPVFMRGCRRWILGITVGVLALATLTSCAGSSSSSHTAPGTPAGTYTATVTAKLGSADTSTTLTVIVQ
jgi:hypothetical protein